MTDRKYWLGFSLVPEIGPKRLAHLLAHFTDIAEAWGAPEPALLRAGVDRRAVENLLQTRRKLNLDDELDRVTQTGARIITPVDDDYPALLKTLSDPPIVLYLKGQLLPDDNRSLAIVGTRKATTSGRDAARKLAQQLAAQRVTIISGLAHGIDRAAHLGAIEGSGRTIAILGNGIDRIYPRDHADLASQIISCGALVSEFPVGMPPEGRNFPRRNRLISGMSLGVLIAEAPEHSGALITAETASEQGREVFAIPANIFNPMGRGSNRLIQEGAKLVMDVHDILDELDLAYTNVQTMVHTTRIVPENPTEAQVLQLLGADPLHVDELVRLSQLPIQIVSSTLTILELKGLVQSVGNMQYCLIVD